MTSRTSRIRKSAAVALAYVFTPLLVLLAPAPAHAQNYADFFSALVKGRNVSNALLADDSDTALLIKYVGTQQSGIIDIAANGDITFKHGASGSEVVDTTVECDASIAASGSRNGIVDVSVAACDTIIEVLNVVLAQSSNWVIVPIDALLTDDLNAGGSGSLVTVTGSSASTQAGFAAKWDTDTKLISTIALIPREARSINFYLSGNPTTAVQLKPNPFAGLRTKVVSARATSTYGSGTSAYAISQEVMRLVRTGPNGGVGGTISSVIDQLYGPEAGGATTVQKTFVALSDNNMIWGDDGAKLVLRLTNSAAMASTTHVAYGVMYNTSPRP